MKDIKIGLVNGLLYHDYKFLIDSFLDELKVPYVISGKTNKKILENGKNILVDESCLSMKIFFGHILELVNKCDYILVIRCPCLRKKEMMCTNFYALYDLANNLFPNKIIELNIDQKNKIDLKKSFMMLGKKLGFSKKICSQTFDISYSNYLHQLELKHQQQLEILRNDNKKVLLVGHSYNILDDYISGSIKDILKDNNIDYILSNYFNEDSQRYKKISKDVYWSKSIDILKAITEYKDDVDGIILISAFPCGPDSLVNEMILRKIKLPILNLIIDEANDNGGIMTRVESFIDIINMKEEIHD